MAILAKDLMRCVVRPALTGMGWLADNVAQQLMGTAAQESQLGSYLRQQEGPAMGLWQMEPATHQDIHKNFLAYRKDIRSKIYQVCGMKDYGDVMPPDECLVYNLYYACLMARLRYMRCKDPIPDYGDIQGQAKNWKNNYNTVSGKGDASAYMINFERFLKSYYDSLK